MGRNLPSIPDSELEVLGALWAHGKGTVREILGQLQWAGRRWSYATVSTLLQRLEQKHLVTSDKGAFAHVYKAAVSRPAVVERRLKALIEKVYDGEPGQLVVHLLQSHKLSEEHRHAIRKLMEEDSEP
jgi:predicted transcriptional regulator